MLFQKIDLIGKIFGRLTVIGLDTLRKNEQCVWICLCSCGKVCKIRGACLRRGDSKSCGCLSIEKLNERCRARKKNFAGQTINGVFLIERTEQKLRGSYKYRARCPKCLREDWIVYPGHVRAGSSMQCNTCCFKSRTSNSCKMLLDQIEQYFNLSVIREYSLGKYYFDGYLEKFKVLIESDGTYWHSIEKAKIPDQNKNLLAKEKGFHLIRVTNDGPKNIEKALLTVITEIESLQK